MAVLDVDGDDVVETGVDGTLIARYFLGDRGDDLIDGISLSGSTRDSSEEIEGYIKLIWHQLDVDGDGEVTASDVNLITRYLSGLTDSQLVNSIASPRATRRTAEEIQDYLAGLI